VFQAGQPDDVRAAYRKAMGLSGDETRPADRSLN
jgi:hypothetical protein